MPNLNAPGISMNNNLNAPNINIAGKTLTIKQQYRQQRQRIQRFIRRAEKRGYNVEYKLPAIPKRITQASVERLRKITPKKLYAKSTAYDYIADKTDTGTAFRQLERRIAALKGIEKRRYAAHGLVAPPTPTVVEKPVELPYAETLVHAGDIMLDSLQDMIAELARYHPRAAARVQNALDAFMSTGNRDDNLRFIAQHGKELENFMREALSYGKGDDRHEAAIMEIITIFNGGEKPTAEQAREWSDLLDADNDITRSININRSNAAKARKL